MFRHVLNKTHKSRFGRSLTLAPPPTSSSRQRLTNSNILGNETWYFAFSKRSLSTTSNSNNKVDDDLLHLYHQMHRIRAFEHRTVDLFKQGFVKGTAHSCEGQEATAVGVCTTTAASSSSLVLPPLTKEDYILSHHRGHGHVLAKGADMGRCLAELCGRKDGYCGGLGGSMHLADFRNGILGANGVVGAGLALGCGAGMAAKMEGKVRVAVAFFGDGASNQGLFHEALNMAAIWKLPVLFFCENNQVGLSTDIMDVMASDVLGSILPRTQGYGTALPSHRRIRVDGSDVLSIREAVSHCVSDARDGLGPSVIEALTFRHGGHNIGQNLPDNELSDEDRMVRKKDPLFVLRTEMIERMGSGNNNNEQEVMNAIRDIETRVAVELDEAQEFALASPEPTMEDLDAAVFAEPSVTPTHVAVSPPPDGDRVLSFAEAIAEAHRLAMRSDSRVVAMGEDIAELGGIFQCTKDLHAEFGSQRIIETPISEACIGGAAVGAAATNLVVPVVEVQIMDMVTLMMDNIVNQAAKWRFMLGGNAQNIQHNDYDNNDKPQQQTTTVHMPIVIRGPQGGGHRLAAQHSQSLESWFTSIPGLKVVMPSTPYDAKGLLLASIRDPNPVIFLEHKNLYQLPPSIVPEQDYEIPLGVADIKRQGSDVTVVATSNMVHEALKAARRLENNKTQKVSVEVIDPRTLWPLDETTILNSIKKTSRLVIAHEAPRRGGWGAELSSLVQEKAFDFLDAPIAIVAGRDAPLPYNANLEKECIPGASEIMDACFKVVARPGRPRR